VVKRRVPVRDQLLVAKAQLRAVAKLLKALPGPTVEVNSSDRFVALCTVNAGRASILHALDGLGRIWKYDYLVDAWYQLGVERREGKPPAREPRAVTG